MVFNFVLGLPFAPIPPTGDPVVRGVLGPGSNIDVRFFGLRKGFDEGPEVVDGVEDECTGAEDDWDSRYRRASAEDFKTRFSSEMVSPAKS